MTIPQALDIWARACASAQISWYLYGPTLLCAHGLGSFPAEPEYARVAVFGRDLPKIAQKVMPTLPDGWQWDRLAFASGKGKFCFQEAGKTVLGVDILLPVADDAEKQRLQARLEQIRRPLSKALRRQHLAEKLLGKKIAGLFRPGAGVIRRVTDRLFSLAAEAEDGRSCFCDRMTEPEGYLLPGELFSETAALFCEGRNFPAFSGYRRYLEDVYGDYEAGLTDEIGVGLTAEEKAALRSHQQRCLEALAFLQELSRELGLEYFLLAGSVLGPVRHGGFIPWDDDVDVGIRIGELERFEAAVKAHLPKRLPEGFALMQSGADNPYPRMFSKICYEGRCCIDLWPLVPTYTDGWRAKFTWYFAKIITKVHYYKIGQKITRFTKIVKPLAAILSDRQVMALARRNEQRYAKKAVSAYINLYSIYSRSKETIRSQWLDEPATVNFSGLNVPAVGHTEEYLTHLYGDYMARPAPWKRASRHVTRFL